MCIKAFINEIWSMCVLMVADYVIARQEVIEQQKELILQDPEQLST